MQVVRLDECREVIGMLERLRAQVLSGNHGAGAEIALQISFALTIKAQALKEVQCEPRPALRRC